MREKGQYSGSKNSIPFCEAFPDNIRCIYLVALGLVVLFIVLSMMLGGK